jgi:hypothetical protein
VQVIYHSELADAKRTVVTLYESHDLSPHFKTKNMFCYGQITEVMYVSIMCLAGIHGNLVADLKTYNTPNDLVYNCAIQCTYIRYLVLKYILKRWHYSGQLML